MKPIGAGRSPLRKKAAQLIDAHGDSIEIVRTLRREFADTPVAKIYQTVRNERASRRPGGERDGERIYRSRQSAIVCRLNPDVDARFRAAAEERNVSAYALARALLTVIVDDQMIDAVLDGALQ